MKSDGEAMITGAGSNHSLLTFCGVERQKLVEGPAFLELAGHLQVVEFEEHARPCHTAYRFGIGAWRAIDR